VLQTFPRVLGYVFNPVSFWYCHDRSGALIAILAEVNNTFGGSTATCCIARASAARRRGNDGDKLFHVSPFNEIEGGYRFRFHRARRAAGAHRLRRCRGELLLTSISGKPRDWSAAALLGAFLRMPFLTLGVIARIHWQALKLWLKGVPFRGAHPATQPLQESTK
jgi:DUF1365 family protein